MLSTTVTPPSPSAARMSTTLAALVLSSPVVGSSRNMMAGDVSSSVAMETRRFSPPLSPRVHSSPTKACATPSTPSDRMVLDTILRIRALKSSAPRVDVDRFPPSRFIRSVAWNVRCSQTVDVPGNTSSCGTYPARPRIAAASATTPLTRIVPPTTRFAEGRPARMSSKVDLPAPEGPRIANNAARRVRVRPTNDDLNGPNGDASAAVEVEAWCAVDPIRGSTSSTPAMPLTPRRIARPPTRSHVTSSQDRTCRSNGAARNGASASASKKRTEASAVSASHSAASAAGAPRTEDSSSMSVRRSFPRFGKRIEEDASSDDSSSTSSATPRTESSSSSPPLAKPRSGAVFASRSRSRDRRRDPASPSRATARRPSQSIAARHGPFSAFRSIR